MQFVHWHLFGPQCHCKISVMPNGCIEAACDHCKFVKKLHHRDAENYNCWIGWYCDDCSEWIDWNQEHWRLFHIMKMVDKSKAHPLSLIIADHSLGHIIASFAEQTWWGD